MAARFTPWGGTRPARDEIEERQRTEGVRWSAWGSRPHHRHDWHEHSYRDVVWCVVGSITFYTQ